MLSKPTAKLLTTLSCGPARSRNSSSTRSVSRVRTPSQPSIAREERVARRRQLVLPDRRVAGLADEAQAVVRDDRARRRPSGLRHAARRDSGRRAARGATKARIRSSASVRFSRELAYEIRMWFAADAAERRAREDAHAGLLEQPVRQLGAGQARSRRCPGRRRTRPAAGGSGSPGSRSARRRSGRAGPGTPRTIASTSSCGPRSASIAPAWANAVTPRDRVDDQLAVRP